MTNVFGWIAALAGLAYLFIGDNPTIAFAVVVIGAFFVDSQKATRAIKSIINREGD